MTEETFLDFCLSENRKCKKTLLFAIWTRCMHKCIYTSTIYPFLYYWIHNCIGSFFSKTFIVLGISFLQFEQFLDWRLYVSKILTHNSHFLLSRSGNSSKKNSHFYLIESGNLSGNCRKIGPNLILLTNNGSFVRLNNITQFSGEP